MSRYRLCIYAFARSLSLTLKLDDGKKELNQQKLLRTSIVFFFFPFPFSSSFHAILVMYTLL